MKRRRSLLVFLVLLCAGALLGGLALSRGAVPVSLLQLGQIFFGEAPAGLHLMVVDWRLPRVLMAMLTGAALGVSGAVFQSLLRNPLGSPDVLGLNTGAFSCVLLVMVFWPDNLTGLAVAALAGGLLTAVAVYGFAWQRGIATFRLILTGIGIRALLMSLNSWLITSTTLSTAFTAGLWSAGSLNGLNWNSFLIVTPALLITFIFTAMLIRRMRLLEMGDDTARALGVDSERSRLYLLLAAVILTTVPTAVIGPVSFVALIAPQIAFRMIKSQQGLMVNTALTGSLLMLAADYLAQHLFIPYQLPVGVITVSLGGIYMLALLVREARRL